MPKPNSRRFARLVTPLMGHVLGPSLNGIHGRKQKVIRNGKTVEVTIDDSYLLRAISEPLAEAPVGYPPAMPNLSLSDVEQKALVQWIMGLK
jgi:cytochrome c oxidase subunit 2